MEAVVRNCSPRMASVSAWCLPSASAAAPVSQLRWAASNVWPRLFAYAGCFGAGGVKGRAQKLKDHDMVLMRHPRAVVLSMVGPPGCGALTWALRAGLGRVNNWAAEKGLRR